MKLIISVVLTCFNRKNMTVRCIAEISKQTKWNGNDIDLQFFVCDDHSTDGTGDALKQFPSCHVINGTGDLFWARGMRKAADEAEKINPDFYLMINDDVSFYDNMIDVMLSSYYAQKGVCAVVGATKSAIDGKHTYGGINWNRRAFKEIQAPVEPSNPCPTCNQANWNCFLMPREVYDSVGKIDDYYEHSYADFDYSNRIIEKGFKIYVSSDYIGTCERNPITNTWKDISLPLTRRIRLLHKKNGLPVKSRYHYCKKWYGGAWIYQFMKPYLHILKSSMKKGQK